VLAAACEKAKALKALEPFPCRSPGLRVALSGSVFSLVVRYIWGYVHVISCHDVSCLRIKSVFWCMSWCVNSGHFINLCVWKDFDVFIPFFIGELQTLTEGCCKSEDGNGTISAEELYQFLIGSIDALGFTAMLNSSAHPVFGLLVGWLIG